MTKTSEVFGIRPVINDHSYIDRGALDKALAKLIDRKQTHVAIRGASKSGKSWLRQRVLFNPVIVQCRLSYSVIDIYRDALAKLGITLQHETSTTTQLSGSLTASGEAGFKLLAKVTGQFEGSAASSTTETKKVVGKDLQDLEFIAALIRESGRVLVVEDFHYLTVSEQRRFAFDLKTLWDYQTFVVVVGVWISENMLITLNPDLSDRIEELSVTWTETELRDVLRKGCQALNLVMKDSVEKLLAEISYESVGLLQKLALRLIDDELGIVETSDKTVTSVDDVAKVSDAAMHIAEQLNQLYQTFAKRVSDGIRVRKNSTGIYAHAMAAVISADDNELISGMSARRVFDISHAKQSRIQLANLKTVLSRFPELQVDDDGRGLVLAYDPQDERISVVDKQLLLYRRFATVKWPWDDLIAEAEGQESAYE